MQPYQAESMQQIHCRTQMQENPSHKQSIFKPGRQSDAQTSKSFPLTNPCFGAVSIFWRTNQMLDEWRQLTEGRANWCSGPLANNGRSVSRAQREKSLKVWAEVKQIGEPAQLKPFSQPPVHPRSFAEVILWSRTGPATNEEAETPPKCTQDCQGWAIYVFSSLDWLLGLYFHPINKEHATLGVKKQDNEGPCMCETWVFCSD